MSSVAGKSGLKLWVVAGDAGNGGSKPAPLPGESVGLFLRLLRERKNVRADEAAAQVRIRAAYIQAIEDDRFDLLPGRAYAMGFVRAYAEYLGSDVEATVNAALAEIDRLPAPELRARKPEAERGSRVAPLAAAAICLALSGYVYWYFDNTRERFENAAETLARVDAPNFVETGETTVALAPTPFRPFPNAAPPETTQTPVAANPQPAAPAPQPAPVAEALPQSAPPPTVAKAPLPPTRPSTTAEAPGLAAGDAANPPVAFSDTPAPRADWTDAPAPAPLPPRAVLAADLPAPRLEAPRSSPIWSIPAPGSAMASTTHAIDLQAESRPAPEPTADSPPPAPGEVTLRAIADTWVQIKATKTGKVLFSRVLRVGETYRAPDRQGLRMTVGNAGGLEILVDGETAPSLGGHGEVVRDLDLSGPALLARN